MTAYDTGPAAAAPPRLRGRSPGVSRLVGALVAMLALTATACGGGGRSLTVENTRVDEPDALLVEAERLMAAVATEENANTAADSQCFFSRANEDAEEENPFLRCGPILFMDSNIDAPWMTVRLRIEAGGEDDGDRNVSVGDISDRSSRLADSEVLVRPDGNEPSEESLSLPDPPPVAADYAEARYEPVTGVRLKSSDNGVLSTVGWEFVISEYALVDRIGDGPDALVAADGYELLIAEVQLADRHESLWNSRLGSQVADPTVNLSIDGVRQDLPEHDASGEPIWWVISVPADSDDIAIELSALDFTSTFNVRTGDRAGHPGFYLAHDLLRVNQRYDRVDRTSTADDAFTFTLRAMIDNIHVTPFIWDLAAADGELLVAIEAAEWEVMGDADACFHPTIEGYHPFGTLTADGESAELATDQALGVWRIPADTEVIWIELQAGVDISTRVRCPDSDPRNHWEYRFEKPMVIEADLTTGAVTVDP